MAGLFDDLESGAKTGGSAGGGMFDDLLTPKSSIARRLVGDTAISALKSAIAVPEAAVGIADLVTGGKAGKILENEGGIGFRPKEAKAILDEYLSPEQKTANEKLAQADGFVDTLATAVDNPSTILHTGIESIAPMLAGGVVARGVMAAPGVAGKVAPWVAGAIGEGTISAGMGAESIRQQTEDGLLTGEQAGLAGLAGVGTGLIGAGGAKIAQKLGVGEIDTLLAGGNAGAATTKGIARKAAEGAAVEGVFQELPQSTQEQALQNIALGKPWDEGLGNAAAMGLLTGAALGGIAGPLGGKSLVQPQPTAENPAPAPVPAPDPAAGPISRSAAQLPGPSIAGLLPDPGQTLYGDAAGNLSPDGPSRNVDREYRPTGRERGPQTFGPGMDQSVPMGEQAPLEGQLIRGGIGAGPQPAQRTPEAYDNEQSLGLPAPSRAIPDMRGDNITVAPDGTAVPGKTPNIPPAPYIQGGPGMDQQREVGKTYRGLPAANRAIRESANPEQLEAVKVGPQTFEVRAKQKPAKRVVNRDRDTLAQAVIRLGGIKTEWRQDTTGDTKGNKFVPGVGALWSDKTGASIDDMASLLDQNGYVPAGEMDNLGGVPWLQAALRDELSGRKTHVAPGSKLEEAQAAKAEADYLEAQIAAAAESGDLDAELDAKIDMAWDMGDDAAEMERRRLAAEAFAAELDEIFGDAPNEQKPEPAIGSTDRAPQGADSPADGNSGSAGEGEPGAVRGADARAESESEVTPALELQSQTEEELAAADAANKARIKAEEKAQAEAEQKAQADRDRNDFTLTGSDRPSDVAAARGQNDMFAPPTRGEKKAEQEQAANNAPETESPASTSERQPIRFVSGQPASEYLADGSTIEDGSGQQYRVHYQRNDLVVAHPIVDGKAQVNADSTVRFHVGSPESADGRRTDPIYLVEGRSQQAPESVGQQLASMDADDLSALIDEVSNEADAQRFIAAPDGSTDFGEITSDMAKAAGRQAGKIRLQQGNESWGLQHIEQRHGAEIRDAGFADVPAFVADIAQHIDQVWKPAATRQLVALHKVGNNRMMFVELQPGKDEAGDFYTVNTAFTSRKAEKKGWKLLWEARAQASGESGNRPSFAVSPPVAGGEVTNPSSQSSEPSIAPPAGDKPAAKPKSKPAAKPDAKLEDAGEKLGGARKDQLRTVRDRLDDMGDEEIAGSSLSQLWPKGELDKISDPFEAALYHVVRGLIPAKPRVSYRVKAWVGKVKAARDILTTLGGIGANATAEKMRAYSPGLGTVADQIEVLMALDRKHWGRIDGVRRATGRYSQDGEMVPGSWVSLNIDGRQANFYGHESVASAIPAIKDRVEGKDAPEKRMKFAIYTDRQTSDVFVVKEGDAEMRRLKTFKSVKEARAFLNDEYEAAVALWDAVKNRDNVTKSDMRRSTNDPRVGQNHRDGKDVTPDQFLEAFGFRGVEFGNWVKQGAGGRDRQGMLNDAYDAFMDLAMILNIPPKALSLEGKLGIGFGSRGSGKASAHYEPDRVVINMTKTKGAGTLAHEWFHALDNYFARRRAEQPGSGIAMTDRETAYITYRPERLWVNKKYPSMRMTRSELSRYQTNHPGAPLYQEGNWEPDAKHPNGVRPQVEKAFAELVETLNASPMLQRAKVIDGKTSDGYWSRIIERGARSFETYVIARLADQGFRNDYLANVQTLEQFSRDPGRYPYLTPDEQGPVNEAFDKLFATLETKETDQGVALFSRASGPIDPAGLSESSVVTGKVPENPISLEQAIAAAEQFLSDYNGNIELNYRIRKKQDELYGPGSIAKIGVVKGAYHPGRGLFTLASDHLSSAADAYETLRHEILGHYGLDTFSPQDKQALLDKILASKEEPSLKPIWDDIAVVYADKSENIQAEEVFARLAEGERSGKEKLADLIGSLLARLLRKMFPAKKGVITRSELLREIEVISKGIRNGNRPRKTFDSETNLRRGEQTETPAFKRWFGESKVVDANGEPMVVYHGTTADFTAFDRNETRTGVLGEGFYFSPEPERTRSYAGGSRFGGQGYAEGGSVMPVYVSLQNPLVLRAGQRADLSAESKGHDGVIQLDAGGGIETVVAFSPEQIKSATGNNGNFDPANPDIRYRLSDTNAKGIPLFSARDIAKKVMAATGLNATVVNTEADLPADLQAQIKRDKATGRVAGVYHNGTAYLVAANLRDTKHAISVMLHEAIGHGGVKSVLGDRIGKVMAEIYRDMPAAMRKELERRYAKQIENLSDADANVLIAEEYVAHLAETDPQHSVINRLVALLRRFIRDTFGKSMDMKWTRNDIVQLLAEARVAARNNGRGPKGAGRYRKTSPADALAALPEVDAADESAFVASLKADAATRSFASAMYKARGTESPFFKAWFGKSRMVDKQGQPIAFVHRSYGERDTFTDADLGKNTGTPTAALGHFLARKDVGNVERYGPVVEQFYIRMEKPKVITQAQFEAMGDWSLAKVQAYRKTLMEQGYDGLYIQGLAWPVVFEGKNIKARRNAGTFDNSDSVRYSLDQQAVERQFAETAKALGGEQAYNAAKAAGRTELTYRQWVQVRTPAFKAWFGEWENGDASGVGRSDGGSNQGAETRSDSGRDSGTTAGAASGTASATGRAWRLHPVTGEPRVFFHGTRDSFTAFDLNHPNRKDKGWLGRGVYTGSDARLAMAYAKLKGGSGKPRVMDLFANVRKPFVGSLALKQRLRQYSQAQVDAFTNELRNQGYDGVVLELPDGTLELMAFDPANVKSATDNSGAFDPANTDIRYSLNSDAAAREALDGLGMGGKDRESLLQQIRDLGMDGLKAKLVDWGQRSREGLFDGLEGIRRAEEAVGITDPNQQGYVSARQAAGSADVLHAILHYGAPQWKNGIIDYKDGTRGLLEALTDLGENNLQNWLGWLGGKRAELLKAQGRENNLSDKEIAELIALGKGQEELFEKVYREYAQLNEAILDLAEGAGIIDPKARAKWMTDYYVPFYRQPEGEDAHSGPSTKRGLSHQSAAIRALKGGNVPTKDLLSNIMQGIAKRVDASMKNNALLEVVDNLKDSHYLTDESPRYQQVLISRSQIAQQVRKDRKALKLLAGMLGLPESSNFMQVANELMKPQNEGFEKMWTKVAPTDPDIIRVMRDGKAEYYRVNDESLLRGVLHMAGPIFNDPVTSLGRTFKRILTTGVTASPEFILRNYIRDSVHNWMINPDGFKFGIDSIKGLQQAFGEDADFRAMMFHGSSFAGGYIHATDPEASAQMIRRALRQKGITGKQADDFAGSIINTKAKAAEVIAKGWEQWREWGDRVENANRLGVYKAALAAGKSKRQAAFEARDVMDFAMRGNFTAAIWLTDVVPFLNARMQGLYKLGRAMKGDKTLLAKHVAMKGGYVLLFSLLLAAANDDDERYKALPNWDKDLYWHIWLSDDQVQPFRIPKPFELGLLFGTVPERMLHAATGSQDGSDLGRAVAHGVLDTLAFNPLPQVVKPIIEVVANRDFFRDTDIEGMADEGKVAEARYDERTSDIGYGIGQVTGRLFNLSPKQVDHLIKGYTGTLGAYVLGIADLIANAVSEGESPDWHAGDLPLVRTLYQGDSVRSTQYHTEFYDALREADQLYRTVRAYREEGRFEEAQELQADSMDQLRHRPALGFARRQLGVIRNQMESVRRDKDLSGEVKQQRLDDLQRRSNAIAERIARQVKDDF